MRVLFVCSGNKKDGQPGVVVNNQAKSLIENGVEVDFYLITGKGVKGYLKAVKPLLKTLRRNKYSVVHSHFSLSAFVTSFALIRMGNKSIKHVVSLMGSDALLKGWKRTLTRYFNSKKWSETIVKSESMAKDLNLKHYNVIPNGVNTNIIKPSKDRSSVKGVLFAADPNRESKNFELAKKAFELIQDKSIELKVIYNAPHSDVVKAINQSECVLLTSKWEGSPNIIKEAMACNRPIVATKVGDVPWLLKDLDGCYLVDHDPKEVATKIIDAVNFNASKSATKGRERIQELELSSDQVAKNIISLYRSN